MLCSTWCHNFISRLQRRTSGSGTGPGAKHPVVAKSAGGTGFYHEGYQQCFVQHGNYHRHLVTVICKLIDRSMY